MIELTIDTIVGNALIELMERKNINMVTYTVAHYFGIEIVKELEKKGVSIIIGGSRDAFEYSNRDMFYFYEYNKHSYRYDGGLYISYLKSSSTEELRHFFRSYLSPKIIEAMTSETVLSSLGISEKDNLLSISNDRLQSSLEMLIKTYLRTKTLDDTVLALLYSINQKTITKSPALLHRAFDEIKKENKIPLLNEILFINGINHWSDELNESFTRLEISKLLPYIIRGDESWYFLEWSEENQEQAFMQFDEKGRKQIIDGAQILKRLPQPAKR